MGERERQAASKAAINAGRMAFSSEVPYEDCPYKVSPWGLGAFWQMGWQRAKQEEMNTCVKEKGENS